MGESARPMLQGGCFRAAIEARRDFEEVLHSQLISTIDIASCGECVRAHVCYGYGHICAYF